MKISREEAQKVFDPKSYGTVDFASLELESHDPFNKEEFHIANSYVADESHSFFRLSEKEMDSIRPVSKDEAYLAMHSAGIELQFETDSRLIKIKARNLESFSMKNMSFMGMCGFDCYYLSEKHDKFLFNHSTFPNYIDDKVYVGELGYFQTKKMRKIILNLPLYNGVMDLDIRLEKGCKVIPWSYENKKTIVCYGTSILQGCSSSHPGIATTNKLSRYFKQEVLNYGFSGAALLEKEVAEVLANRENVEMYIIDAEANAGMSTKLYENLETFVSILFEAHPSTPIVIMNRIRSTYDGGYPNIYEGHEFNDRVMKEVVDTFKAKGANIRFVDNWALFDEDETEITIEGLHPTDVGMDIITNRYIEVISKIKEECK
ncbi:MAG: SGNH/GDSL hydrolase family protein [Bacilli bacterium]|nr:SGNH/GDSL hydrolase family protein [Bacilli bacterium]